MPEEQSRSCSCVFKLIGCFHSIGSHGCFLLLFGSLVLMRFTMAPWPRFSWDDWTIAKNWEEASQFNATYCRIESSWSYKLNFLLRLAAILPTKNNNMCGFEDFWSVIVWLLILPPWHPTVMPEVIIRWCTTSLWIASVILNWTLELEHVRLKTHFAVGAYVKESI